MLSITVVSLHTFQTINIRKVYGYGLSLFYLQDIDYSFSRITSSIDIQAWKYRCNSNGLPHCIAAASVNFLFARDSNILERQFAIARNSETDHCLRIHDRTCAAHAIHFLV